MVSLQCLNYLYNKSEAEEAERSEADEGAEGRYEQSPGLASHKPVLPPRREVQEVGGQQGGEDGDEVGRLHYHILF